ncbi:hypothetical protein D3C86_1894860 [compost metagenome]
MQYCMAFFVLSFSGLIFKNLQILTIRKMYNVHTCSQVICRQTYLFCYRKVQYRSALQVTDPGSFAIECCIAVRQHDVVVSRNRAYS